MTSENIILISAIFASPFIGILITSFFNKNKTGAETHQINLSGEISIGDAWMKYAKQQEENAKTQKQENKDIRTEMADLKTKLLEVTESLRVMQIHKEEMYKQNVVLAQENKTYQHRVETLEGQVLELQKEVEKYKGIDTSIQHAADLIHAKVEEVKTELTNHE